MLSLLTNNIHSLASTISFNQKLTWILILNRMQLEIILPKIRYLNIIRMFYLYKLKGKENYLNFSISKDPKVNKILMKI